MNQAVLEGTSTPPPLASGEAVLHFILFCLAKPSADELPVRVRLDAQLHQPSRQLGSARERHFTGYLGLIL
jgi:hypothetical protein